jgi:hypothetical protein
MKVIRGEKGFPTGKNINHTRSANSCINIKTEGGRTKIFPHSESPLGFLFAKKMMKRGGNRY